MGPVELSKVFSTAMLQEFASDRLYVQRIAFEREISVLYFKGIMTSQRFSAGNLRWK